MKTKKSLLIGNLKLKKIKLFVSFKAIYLCELIFSAHYSIPFFYKRIQTIYFLLNILIFHRI